MPSCPMGGRGWNGGDTPPAQGALRARRKRGPRQRVRKTESLSEQSLCWPLGRADHGAWLGAEDGLESLQEGGPLQTGLLPTSVAHCARAISWLASEMTARVSLISWGVQMIQFTVFFFFFFLMTNACINPSRRLRTELLAGTVGSSCQDRKSVYIGNLNHSIYLR